MLGTEVRKIAKDLGMKPLDYYNTDKEFEHDDVVAARFKAWFADLISM